jgi:hypothetical protein
MLVAKLSIRKERQLLEPVLLGELIRHLQAWQSLYEAEGTDCLTGPDGDIYCLADLTRLYELSRHLDPLQALAIRCLYEDIPDAEAARMMSTDGSRQVSDYAQDGLRRLCVIFESPAGGAHDDGPDDAGGHVTAPGEDAAALGGLPPPGGLRERADPGLAGRRDLALCQV